MKFYPLLLLFTLFACNQKPESPSVKENEKSLPATITSKPVIVIHGGAGYITAEVINDSVQQIYHNAIQTALNEGRDILNNGGSALEAVESTIMILENNPLFNAGKGSVLTHRGEVENDASIMDGSTLNCGAIAGVQNVKNPIQLAKYVKDSTKHVMLSGNGAFEFAQLMKVEIVDQEYYMTDQRRKEREAIHKKKMGTVGCVALDMDGNIAAGTSTGGMSDKRWGRIGDSPIIGAGTYANSSVAGVSCTGHGEYYIKNAVAYDVIALMDYKGISLEEACDYIINDKLKKQEAPGGLIAVDKNGNWSMTFNTPGMFRAVYSKDTTFTALW